MVKDVILDIRTNEEFCSNSGHVCGAILVETPKPPLKKSDIDTLKKKLVVVLNKENVCKFCHIAVYCKKGIRAGKAVELLKIMGYKNVELLGGVEINPLKNYIKKGKYKMCKCQRK